MLFDPLGEYLRPRLRIYRLGDGGYRRLEEGETALETLGLEAVVVDGALRLREPSGRLLPTVSQSEARAREAERELAELRQRLEALQERAGSGGL